MRKFKAINLLVILIITLTLFGCGLTKNRAKEIVEEVERKTTVQTWMTPFACELSKTGPATGEYYNLYMEGRGTEEQKLALIDWLYQKKYITNNNITRNNKSRIDFNGNFTQAGLEYFSNNPTIHSKGNWGNSPIGYEFRFVNKIDYEVDDITIIGNRAEIKYYIKYEWVNSDYTKDLKDKVLKNLSLKSKIQSVNAIKSDNKGWIKN